MNILKKQAGQPQRCPTLLETPLLMGLATPWAFCRSKKRSSIPAAGCLEKLHKKKKKKKDFLKSNLSVC